MASIRYIVTYQLSDETEFEIVSNNVYVQPDNPSTNFERPEADDDAIADAWADAAQATQPWC